MFHRSAAIGHKLTSAPGDMAHRAAAMYFDAVGRLENCKTDVERGERGQKKIRPRREAERRKREISSGHILIRLNRERFISSQF